MIIMMLFLDLLASGECEFGAEPIARQGRNHAYGEVAEAGDGA